MKKISNSFLFFNVLGVLLFSACKETPPKIDYSVEIEGLLDTTYINSTPPASINKKIYLEDLTGVKCPNCPKAAEKVHIIDTTNEGKVVAIAAYPFSLSGLTAPWDGFLVLNTEVSDEIFTNVYNSPSLMPIGGVNRRVFAGETGVNTSYNKWSGFADIIKQEVSPLIIEPKIVELDTVNSKLKISVKSIFTKEYIEPLNLTIYIIEDGLISKQSMPGSEPPKDNYVHNHVLRKSITPYNGIPLKTSTTAGNYELGRTYEKEFQIQLDSKWKYKNCSIVILVNRHDEQSKEVLQAAEMHLH